MGELYNTHTKIKMFDIPVKLSSTIIICFT